jgi:hypothetical protein
LIRLANECRTHSSAEEVHKRALAYPLKKGRYDLIAAGDVLLDPSLSQGKQRKMTEEYMTDISMILAHEEIGMVWERLPSYVQTRTPRLIYRASEVGFDLSSTYFEKIRPFANDHTRTCMMFIRTKEDENFGLYLDDILK